MTSSTSFTILGLTPSASPSDVKLAWRKLSTLYHPDKPGGDPVKFDSVQKAYELAMNHAKVCKVCKGTRTVKFTQGFYSINRRCTSCK